MTISDGVRRVVTTHDKSGKSVVMSDSMIGLYAHEPLAASGVRQFVFWLTESAPARTTEEDVGARKVKIPPPPRGTIFRMVDFPPEHPGVAKLPLDHMAKILGDVHHDTGHPSRHPFMHRTKTVDYIIVMSGEIDMLLDEGEVHLKAGDVLVQQSTNHSWVNRGTEICRLCVILVDAADGS
jgi:mannose-6-phosphate isomerase-like protein (cupin superfamily)